MNTGLKMVVLLPLALVVLLACQRELTFHGWPVTPVPAANFALTAQSGEEVQLSGFRGDLVVLTFIYTNCTTACPITTFKLKLAADQLAPGEAERVHFVAVSVDPERDTPESALEFLEVRPSPPGLLWLMGTRAELEPVWRSYNIETRQVMPTPTPIGMEGTPMPMATPMEGMTMEGEHAGHVGYIVEHTIIAYLIDREGMIRAAYITDQFFEPDDLVNDIRTLLALD